MDTSKSSVTKEPTKISEEKTTIKKSQISNDIQEELDMINSKYVFHCIGSTYGCPEKTNGNQYCSKYYCPYEEIMKEI